ncbi:E3 ubiquitin-protein ligase At1g12760-like [Phragmites australis]|uniref:E3 ubiquitin-protein ligase At1g12760-like n=1 Tax=Phragmites australis TaxID=29695 RepID=UPI002D77CADC|nr:E3 ubiquitin-protein ligase At1g12760-like [Phragmites australis]XP_062188732.1 E3 ubiquitin-protein ligase At1g12760-like [Phragmites australis]
MDHSGNLSHRDHTIDIPRNDVTSSSTSLRDNHNGLDELHHDRVPSNEVPPVPESSSGTIAASNSRNASVARRDQGRRQQNPLNSGIWISIELIVNVTQIIAAISVLSVSKNEHPHAPLSVWLIGYTIGCIATLPHLYWRYLHRNRQNTEQEQTSQDSFERNISEPNSYTSEVVDSANSTGVSRTNFTVASPRVYAMVACFKLALDFFFAVWFVVGNVWIFGSHSSVHDAPNLYRLCIVFLAFGFISYALPFILCTMICCCLPCIISMMGFHEDLDLNRGAATEAINALVAYKFKSKKIHGDDVGEDGGGVLAAGTDKERTISAEDAVCCICLSKFSNNEDLRELPCTHVFHMECVDKWLQINALCPLCKAEIGGSTSVSETGSGGPRSDNRVGDDVESQR